MIRATRRKFKTQRQNYFNVFLFAEPKAPKKDSRPQKTQENKKTRLERTAFLENLPDEDSNLDKGNQNPLCYRYTIG